MDQPAWWADHRPGLLNRALQGLKRLETNQGFTVSEVSDRAKGEYREDSNPARTFLKEHCRQKTGSHVRVEILFQAYTAWSIRTGSKTCLDNGSFGKEVV